MQNKNEVFYSDGLTKLKNRVLWILGVYFFYNYESTLVLMLDGLSCR